MEINLRKGHHFRGEMKDLMWSNPLTDRNLKLDFKSQMGVFSGRELIPATRRNS